MELSLFDGDEDAYWWILSTESYFRATGKSEMAKMMVAALAMRGEALKWWLWWSHRHSRSNWDTFTTALLWRFKHEWRHLLPVLEEETEEACELSQSAVKLVTDIAGANNLNPSPCSKLVEKPPITSDLVDSVTTDAGEHDLDFPLKLEVPLVQLEITTSIGQIQQRSVNIVMENNKFCNRSLSPPSPLPKPPDPCAATDSDRDSDFDVDSNSFVFLPDDATNHYSCFLQPQPAPRTKPLYDFFRSQISPPQALELLLTHPPTSPFSVLPPASSLPPKPPDPLIALLPLTPPTPSLPPKPPDQSLATADTKFPIHISFSLPYFDPPTLNLQLTTKAQSLIEEGGYSNPQSTLYLSISTIRKSSTEMKGFSLMTKHGDLDYPVKLSLKAIPPPKPPDKSDIPAIRLKLRNSSAYVEKKELPPMFNLPHRPPAKPPHYSHHIELNEVSVDWVQFRFFHKSYGRKSFHYSIWWKIYKGLETRSVVWCDNYPEVFPTFKCKREFECAKVKIVTIIHEDYEYCIYLLVIRLCNISQCVLSLPESEYVILLGF
ncbi:hypothetical protein MtrunA17_Chr8g0392231 [Medicago truncatula]|uniref:Swarming motility protein ybiA n=1 Tax=Medicago truncatula TaxID=3880 RepID=A0A396GTH2_MEDTR|nr:hypothetical protein MtrunA17_Chr8g0392231 [Medicago truncatula]